MTFNDISVRAGSLSRYWFYIFVGFVMYLVNTALGNQSGGWLPLLALGFGLVITPFIAAGVYGGIYQMQQKEELSSLGGFWEGVKRHFWRMVLVELLYFASMIVIAVFITSLSGTNSAGLFGIKVSDLISVPFSVLLTFWFSAMVVERKLFRGLWTGIKLFFSNRYALMIGMAWGVVCLADIVFRNNALIKQAPFLINFLPAIVYAILKTLAIAYVLAITRLVHGGEQLDVSAEAETAPAAAGDGLAKAGFGFAFFAFVPVVHLAALVLGILALRRKKQFVMKAAIACFVGGFFTIFYVLILAGLVISGVFPAKRPGYSFLSEANGSLQPQVALLNKGLFSQVRSQLAQNGADSVARDWTVDCALAIATNNGFALNDKTALEYFYTAAGKNPDKGEFYFYYGLALVRDGQMEKAGQEFKTALQIEPNLAIAGQYLDLVNNAYYPPQFVTALLFFIILMVSFTFHEYGHAYSAWKMGDDTAKNLGRLTLNPIAHLDLFGSIILPGIMLAQQSGMVFGWAKPVPVDPRNFRNPRKDHMIVSFAGPATNLMIATACFLVLGILMVVVRLFWPETITIDLATPYHAVSIVGPPFAKAMVVIVIFIKQIFYTNLVLGCLNLLPFPPLDGSWILSGLLPGRLEAFFEKVRMFGPILFLALVLSPVLGFLLSIPIEVAWVALQALFSTIGG